MPEATLHVPMSKKSGQPTRPLLLPPPRRPATTGGNRCASFRCGCCCCCSSQAWCRRSCRRPGKLPQPVAIETIPSAVAASAAAGSAHATSAAHARRNQP
eukprot:14706355-Alexandrium_andersonii.AAC.1